MQPIGRALAELTRIFRAAPDKRTAHARSRVVLERLSEDPAFLTEALERYLRTPESLNASNYPVVAVEIATTPEFVLVAHCWIPLPDGRTDLSTKAIHHHGSMLLSTANIFGPGYEHWIFTFPQQIGADVYEMKVVEAAPHKLHQVAFVDARTPHLPVYPPSLTVTLALWSSEHPTTWKDRVKRIPVLKRNERSLRRIAGRLGLSRTLELKIVEDFDFCPVDGGFRNIRDRLEFERGPNEDHLHSLFHVLQATGNEALAKVAEERLATPLKSPAIVKALIADLESGRKITGRLSKGHYDVPYANFTTDAINRSLRQKG
jgi:hypothetical protein